MAHLSEGTLRRMVDDPDARAGADSVHLESCAECQSRLEAISEDARSIALLLAVPEARVDVARAFARVNGAPTAQPVMGIRLPVLQSAPRRLTLALVAAVAAAALVVVGFAASGLFYKPTTVTAVPVTFQDIQALYQLADYGTVTTTKQPDFTTATSAADAAATAGFAPPALQAGYKLPNGISPTVTYVAMSQAVATFKFDAAKASATASRHGSTLPKLPSGMDGATLTITVGPVAGAVYGEIPKASASSAEDLALPQLVIARSAPPVVTSTQVTVQQLRDYILQLPLSPELKKAIRDVGDPSNKLFVPVPADYATSTPVSIGGSNAGDGLALGDNTGVGAAVVWIARNTGSVYMVAGSVKQTDVKDIANNLK